MLRLHDTRTGRVQPLAPTRRGELRMYACGPNLCHRAHVGDLRGCLLPDLIRRAAELGGSHVTLCQDIRDAGSAPSHAAGGPPGADAASGAGDEHMLARVWAAGGCTPETARRNENAFHADLAALNIRPAEHAPRVSDSIPVIIEIIRKLITSGNAYVTSDGSVFFDARSLPGHHDMPVSSTDNLPRASGPGGPARGAGHPAGGMKRFHADFAVWHGKGTAPRREPMWDAPWGSGSPARGIECSALSVHHLGGAIDVHTCGACPRFAHHESETALAGAVAGHEVSGHWVRGGDVAFDGHAIGDAAGNAATLTGLATRGLDPLALRLALLQHHYRQRMNLTWEAIAAAWTILRGWRERVAAWAREPSAPMSRGHVTAALTAVADDLDTPSVLRVLRDLEADARLAPGVKFETFAYLDRFLGLDVAHDVGKPGGGGAW